MLDNYVKLNRLIRAILRKADDGASMWEAGDSFGVSVLVGYVRDDLAALEALWPGEVEPPVWAECDEALGKERPQFFVVTREMFYAGRRLDDHVEGVAATFHTQGLLDLLHPAVVISSYEHFRKGSFHEAVLNGTISVFDLIRTRSRLDLDGASLVARALSLDRPILRFADLSTESGRSEQKGFIQLLQGVYMAVRNPRAHSLKGSLTKDAAAQQLVFLSWLASRVDAARRTPNRASKH